MDPIKAQSESNIELNQEIDDLMRVFVNKIINRALEDRKNGIYH